MLCIALMSTAPAWGGENPSAKLAMHLVASSGYLDCGDLMPAACDSINVDVSVAEILAAGGYGYIAFVAYDVSGITGVEFAVDGWPTGRGAPTLGGPYWCPEGTLAMGDHLGSGGVASFPCVAAPAGGPVLIGYCSFGPLDEEDLPITLDYAASDFSYPDNTHNYVLDCTTDYQEDSVTAVTGCTVGGTYEGQPECPEQLGGDGMAGDQEGAESDDGTASQEWSVEIERIIDIAQGSFMAPTWSPDGTKLAFTTTGYGGLLVRNADGTGPIVELSDGAAAGYGPVWTPDSRAVVLNVTTVTTAHPPMYHSLQKVDVESGQTTELAAGLRATGKLRFTERGDLEFHSSEGRRVLDMETHEVVDALAYYSTTGESRWECRLDGRVRRLTIQSADGSRQIDFPHDVSYCSLSPTGEKIAFYAGDHPLSLSNLDGSGLLPMSDRASGPAWSSDGRFLVFEVTEDDGHIILGSDLFVADTGDGRVVQLTHTPDLYEMHPCLSPDGTRIAYDVDNQGKICVAVLRWSR